MMIVVHMTFNVAVNHVLDVVSGNLLICQVYKQVVTGINRLELENKIKSNPLVSSFVGS